MLGRAVLSFNVKGSIPDICKCYRQS